MPNVRIGSHWTNITAEDHPGIIEALAPILCGRRLITTYLSVTDGHHASAPKVETAMGGPINQIAPGYAVITVTPIGPSSENTPFAIHVGGQVCWVQNVLWVKHPSSRHAGFTLATLTVVDPTST